MRTNSANLQALLLQEVPSGYELGEPLVVGPSSVVYRGVARANGNAVLLVTTRRRPSSLDVSDLSREYAILTRLSGAPIVHARGHDVIVGRPWLILEDVGGQPLTAVVARYRAPDRAIALALEISRALAEVHRRGIVHQRIEPRHIIVLSDGTVRLTGFGDATERLAEAPTQMLDGALAYIAPEQTGRLNRQVDERADLYALGVVLFELLTGALPFDAPDAAGWIHAHLARQPAAPDSLDHRISPSLSAIVLKLLAKDPPDRYQHARGLQRDLERCATALARGDQTPFELGTDDVTDVFRVSERLHGREREVARLIAGFERAIADASCVISLVPGYSGIGKTSVVSALYQPVARERGRFISGKFDQYKRDIPYATIVQAFRGLMRDVLAASAASLADWRRRVGDAVGVNAGVLADVIPELSMLLGPLPPVAELGPREAQNRFESAFLAFVRVFARAGHPLVLFLDDMQWADDATLGLLQLLGTPSAVPSLHVVLAYRDNEVGPDHRFAIAVDALRALGATIETIPIRELEPPHVIGLVAETVNRTSDDASVVALSRALSEKTGGNPFFIRELLQQLHGRGLFAFDAHRNRWDWDERATDAVDVAGNVVDLLVLRLSNLPAPTQRTLAVAACFGNRFDIDSLAAVLQLSADVVAAALSGARQEGLVVAVGDSSDTGAFRFHHDRIQQAAYSRLADDERTLAHLQIGRVLRARFRDGSDDLLFDAVEHLNRASTLASDRGERRELTLLNLAAGRRAKAAAAWGPAHVYFETAVSLGGEHAWTSHRDETFDAVRELAECDFLTGRFDRAAIHFDDLRGRSVSRIERAGVVTLHVRLLIVTGRYDDALDFAARELESFGESFPIGDAEIAAAIEVGHRRLAHFDFQSLEQMPVLGDSEPRALINLLASLPPAVYSRRPAILPLLAMKIVQLSIEHGNCEASCFGYSLYAMILAATLGQPARALELSRASIALNDRLDDPRLRAPAVHIHANHILFWSHGYDTAIPFLQRAYEAAMHVGDITIAAYVTFMGAWQEIERGHEITETQRALDTHDARAEASRHATARDVVRLQMQFGRALAGETQDPVTLTSSDFDADAARLRISAAGLDTGLVTHDLLRAMLAWLHGRFAEAEVALERGSAALATAYCLPIETTWALFDALTASALWDDASAEARGTLAARVRSAEARLRRWADGCPENFEAKHALVLAEVARLDGRTRDADREYEHAFVAARRSGMLHLQVIASQLASRVALASGLEHVARSWLREQHDVLRAWGATALVTALEATHPSLRTTANEASGGLAQLDAVAAIKASHALARAVHVDDLAQTVLRVVLENAGAQRAVLLLARDGNLTVTASATIEPDAPGDERSARDSFPESIISYVARTRAPLVIADVADDATFSADPYVSRERPSSVLCMPILVGAELAAVLYLENKLIKGAFSPDRIALLDVVSTQLAISLENARLHEDRRRDAADTARQEAVRASEVRQAQQLATIFEQAPVAIAVLRGPEHVFEVANPQYRRFVGDRAVVGKTVAEALPELAGQGIIELLDRVYQSGEPFLGNAVPLRLQRGGGLVDCAFDFVYQPMLDPSGNVTGIAVVAHEVTALTAARRDAEEANRAKDEFLAMLGHELRNPLAPIVTSLQLMNLRANVGAERERAVIERQVHHLVGLVDDLLDVSRITSGKVELRRRPVEVADVVARAIEIASPLLDQKRHALEVAVQRQLFVDADADRLVQVISNLVTNAAKYTQPSGRILIRARPQADQIEISIIDNGIGIDAPMLRQVFEPFAQERQPLDRAQGGLGLGLAIVRNLIKLHGGTVQAKSEGLGRGSEFTVHLPAIDVPIVAATPIQLPPSIQPAELAGGTRVLIVDDNVDAAEMLADLLNASGYQTDLAHDGPSALKAAETFHPQIALLDLGLPVMDGFELARLLQTQPDLATTKLIAITGYGQAQDRARTTEAGFAAHLVKPVNMAQLCTVMEQLLPANK